MVGAAVSEATAALSGVVVAGVVADVVGGPFWRVLMVGSMRVARIGTVVDYWKTTGLAMQMNGKARASWRP